MGVFGAKTTRQLFRPLFEFKELTHHIYECGSRSVPLIACAGMGVALGVVMALHSESSMSRFGAKALVAQAEVLQNYGTSLIGLAAHETGPASAVQGATFRTRDQHLGARRYLRYALSLRNLEEIMAERKVEVDHVAIWRWRHER